MALRTGYATYFADPGDLVRYQRAKAQGKSENYALSVGDNGIGAPALGGVTTTESYGVAVPRSYLIKQFGNDPEAWRRARAQVQYGDRTVSVPIVDIGPGTKQQRRGVITDLTYPLSQDLGTKGKDKVGLNIVGDAGPDYKADPEGWQDEQSQIAQALNPSGYGASMAARNVSPDTGLYAGPDLDEAIRAQQMADNLRYT